MFLTVHLIAKDEIDPIDVLGNVNVEFELIDVAKVVRMTAMLSVVFIGVQPAIEAVFHCDVFPEAGIGGPHGSVKVLFAVGRWLHAYVCMFELDLRFPYFV